MMSVSYTHLDVYKRQVYEKAKALDYAFPNIIAPSAYISPYAKLGCGCVVLQNACVPVSYTHLICCLILNAAL